MSRSYKTKTIKTVAPKENIIQIPDVVSRVKKAKIAITTPAEIPDIIGSKFFFIFICVFNLVGLYTVMNLKKTYNFLKNLPIKINKLYINKTRKKIIITNKSNKLKLFDPVTNLDKSFEKYIRILINKNFPHDSIFGEEYKDKKGNNGFSWFIDPIDGTKKFIIDVPTWANLIGFCYEKKPLLGLANFPELKKFYINDLDKSYLFKNKKRFKLKTSNNDSFKHLNIVANFHGYLSNKDKLKIVKKFGSALRLESFDALNYCLLAEGKLDAVIECNLKSFDILPLIPIIKNSGGVVTNWGNKSINSGGNVVASCNMKLHKKIIKILRPFKD